MDQQDQSTHFISICSFQDALAYGVTSWLIVLGEGPRNLMFN